MHGLDVYPPVAESEDDIQRNSRSVLGLKLETTELEYKEPLAREQAINASPEADETRTLFAELIPLAVNLAGTTGNLIRLRNEYQRTSRRARALEDVLLPEIDQTLAQLDIALEDMDKEEIVRVHFAMKT
jgi:V/A-type H+-transporting ATPase subunit D